MTQDTVMLSQTLSDRIAATIAERIVEGHYAPGQRLVESNLAKQLNVSHGPIRDALRWLQHSGLVTIAAFKGAQVTELSERELEEIYEVRASLVGLRARWLAEDPAREKVLTEVEDLISQFSTMAKVPAKKKMYIAMALSVSQTLTEGLSNRWLRSTLKALTLQTSRYTRMALDSVDRRIVSAKMWEELFVAIREGRAQEAQTLASSLSLSTREAARQSLRALNQKNSTKKI